jgi:hypothetical protein
MNRPHLEVADVIREYGDKLMQAFAHHVGDMLALIADTLQPRDIDELKRHGFGDESPSALSA